ncbi:uncharacterized protein LOC124292109 isoform X1 [Haliotis rubra]|uniref:uncharacterized protein LOC124292109 isoform X1 n=1 Tax=Haliotis rubra TaxID=36100 RepID=UPI001EE59A5E|nr:uncharacterized protein LOC124292109 isoform X1 [Haliotis rubra]
MAQGHEWILQSASFFWIFTLLLSESQSKRTQTYYMDGADCGDRKHLGGATVYSHTIVGDKNSYGINLECRMTFIAENDDWKLMLRIIELDIPDRTENGICNDALYIYDDSDIYTRAMEEAGGNAGLCGNILPGTIYSSGQFLTVHFRTDDAGPSGKGFKFIITAFSKDFEKYKECGSSFQCENTWCIDEDLVCDEVDHCGDYSDEAADGRAKCQQEETGLISRFLSLGVTASIAITVGSVVIVVACIVALVCCCRKSFCKKPQDSSGVTTTATTVVANGAPPANYQGIATDGPRGGGPFSNHGYTHQGYYPMQPVFPTPHGSVYSAYAKDPFPPQGSQYSSQQSQHRSYTPTSSKSGKSNRSNNSTSVTYSQGTEKVSLPVNL